MTPNDPASRQKHEAGGMWIGRNFAVGMTIAILIVLGTIAYAITVVNARAADNQAETARVAKCSIQFTAYRAQYSQGSNTSLRPVIGPDGKPLDPFAGLKPPSAAQISRHLADNCQRYLVPFMEATK